VARPTEKTRQPSTVVASASRSPRKILASQAEIPLQVAAPAGPLSASAPTVGGEAVDTQLIGQDYICPCRGYHIDGARETCEAASLLDRLCAMLTQLGLNAPLVQRAASSVALRGSAGLGAALSLSLTRAASNFSRAKV